MLTITDEQLANDIRRAAARAGLTVEAWLHQQSAQQLDEVPKQPNLQTEEAIDRYFFDFAPVLA